MVPRAHLADGSAPEKLCITFRYLKTSNHHYSPPLFIYKFITYPKRQRRDCSPSYVQYQEPPTFNRNLATKEKKTDIPNISGPVAKWQTFLPPKLCTKRQAKRLRLHVIKFFPSWMSRYPIPTHIKKKRNHICKSQENTHPYIQTTPTHQFY